MFCVFCELWIQYIQVLKFKNELQYSATKCYGTARLLEGSHNEFLRASSFSSLFVTMRIYGNSSVTGFFSSCGRAVAYHTGCRSSWLLRDDSPRKQISRIVDRLLLTVYICVPLSARSHLSSCLDGTMPRTTSNYDRRAAALVRSRTLNAHIMILVLAASSQIIAALAPPVIPPVQSPRWKTFSPADLSASRVPAALGRRRPFHPPSPPRTKTTLLSMRRRSSSSSSSSSSSTSSGNQHHHNNNNWFQKALEGAFANEAFAAPPEGVQATARHILVHSVRDCDIVWDQLQHGTPFGEVAQHCSACPSKAHGGSLGRFGPGTMVAEFDAVVFDPHTPLGQVVGPIQTDFGYHFIVVDRRTGL